MTDETAVPPDIAEQMVRRTPQSEALGFEFVSAVGGVAQLKVPFRDDIALDAESGVIAGGVITTLIDHTCGLAISTALRSQSGDGSSSPMGGMATLDLRIDYLRTARPRCAITARAHCYKLTRSVAFVRAVAFETDPEDPIAAAQAAFALTRAAATGAPQ
jgi:uncharacterized protein (TIGR00369 family)